MQQYAEQMDAATLTQIRQQFEETINKENFIIDLKTERLFLYDEAQRCFTKSRFGKSHLFLPEINACDQFTDDIPG